MRISFDKEGFEHAIIFGLLLAVIFLSGNSAVKQAYQIFNSPEPAKIVEYTPSPANEAENPVYAELPKEEPVFLDGKEILKKKQALAWEKRDFIFADLEKMSLSFYQNGALKEEYPIVAKGAAGSFFEVPSGFYKVQTKTENHLSKIDETRLPWSIYLFGNYLIHGSPSELRSGRREVTTAGVRLSSENARELFADAKEEMPVLVYENTRSGSAELSYFRKTNLPHQVPEVTAAGALAADVETGQILFEKNKNDAFPIASVTKLMTGVVAIENSDPERIMTVDKESSAVGGTMAGLASGEAFKSSELLYPLILPSGNDAATVYKNQIPDFIELMNKKTKELGMAHTYYKGSTGLSEENISDAADLFKLLKYIYTKHKSFFDLTRERQYILISADGKKKHVLANINWPAGDKRYLGGKAGWTGDALQTMAGIYGVRLSEYGWRPIAVVVLGSRSRVSDVRAVVNYLEQGFIYGSRNGQENARPNLIEEGASVHEAVFVSEWEKVPLAK